MISLGIFATGKYGAGWNGVVREEMVDEVWLRRRPRNALRRRQPALGAVAQCGVVLVFGFVMAWVWFKISNLITPIRVPREVEIEGLDMPEMGVLGYSGFAVDPSRNELSSTSWSRIM